MKWSLTAFAVCTLTLTAQDQPAGQLKHLSVPTRTNVNPISVAALAIEREGEYPAIIHLKGSVEIKTPVCLKAGQGSPTFALGGHFLSSRQKIPFAFNVGTARIGENSVGEDLASVGNKSSCPLLIISDLSAL
jgi:hypothetical protein